MIYEHLTNGGWVGFDTCFVERFGRKIPRLRVGIRIKRGEDKINVYSAYLIHKNTEILPDLYKAIGHYLGHRKEEGEEGNAYFYFQHEQETFTG